MNDDEAVRLQTLHDYRVLDTPPEPNFDRITQLAATIFDLPVCTLSLADADRHWFKSHFGVDATEMPRAMSFCDETLKRLDGFVVPDAPADARFAAAPVVAGPPQFRFYAGTPLVTPAGHRIGTLCVLDTKPHHDFSPRNMVILANLAGTSVELLEARSRNLELSKCTEELSYLAGHDALTGLANRRTLQSRFDGAVANARPGDKLALLYIDLDRFKQVNDSFGHDMGDALLKEVSERFYRNVRRSDEVARLGGDEFAVLMSRNSTKEEAAELGNRLLRKISEPYLLRGQSMQVTVSIGITYINNVARVRPRLEEVLRNADIGLYEAKVAGRNQIKWFEVHGTGT